MKFHFEDQEHQTAAIEAVVDLFESVITSSDGTSQKRASGLEGHGHFSLDRSQLLSNLTSVAERENVDPQLELTELSETDLRQYPRSFPNFSVEMETGTGKTYVFIATALRLAELYGLRKFVVLVHTVAIRAGVVKTLEQTRDHFQSKFPELRYRWSVLGDAASALADFVEPSDDVAFLIGSVQGFDKPETNSIYQEGEQANLWEGSTSAGIARIAELQPVVLLDEPQNMATMLRRKTIATLNPLFALRLRITAQTGHPFWLNPATHSG